MTTCSGVRNSKASTTSFVTIPLQSQVMVNEPSSMNCSRRTCPPRGILKNKKKQTNECCNANPSSSESYFLYCILGFSIIWVCAMAIVTISGYSLVVSPLSPNEQSYYQYAQQGYNPNAQQGNCPYSQQSNFPNAQEGNYPCQQGSFNNVLRKCCQKHAKKKPRKPEIVKETTTIKTRKILKDPADADDDSEKKPYYKREEYFHGPEGDTRRIVTQRSNGQMDERWDYGKPRSKRASDGDDFLD